MRTRSTRSQERRRSCFHSILLRLTTISHTTRVSSTPITYESVKSPTPRAATHVCFSSLRSPQRAPASQHSHGDAEGGVLVRGRPEGGVSSTPFSNTSGPIASVLHLRLTRAVFRSQQRPGQGGRGREVPHASVRRDGEPVAVVHTNFHSTLAWIVSDLAALVSPRSPTSS